MSGGTMSDRPTRRLTERITGLFFNPALRAGGAVSALIFLLMLVIYLLEHNANPGFTGFMDALWYTIVTITTIGYGDVTPTSVAGRLAAIILMLTGVVIFGAVSGQIASLLFDRQQKKNRGFLTVQNKTNHMLILGWKPDLELILAGILRINTDLKPSDLVLVNSAAEEQLHPVLSAPQFRGIQFINGDFTEEETLVRANIEKARSVLILPDHSRSYSIMEMDSRTVLAVLSIENLNRKLYVAAELIDEKFRKHLESAHCDEIILSRNHERRLLVSASSGTGMSHVMETLLTEEQGGIIVRDIPSAFVGTAFSELSRYFMEHGQEILVGVLENTGNFYQRKEEALSQAQKNPDIAQVVENLKQVKALKSNRTVLAPGPEYRIPGHSRAILISRFGGLQCAGGQT